MKLVKINFDGETDIIAEVTESALEQQLGLMYREALDDNRGMLFCYSDNQQPSMWMRNTRIPLSIIFADADGVIKGIEEGKPFCEDHIKCAGDFPIKYVIEVNNGFCEKNKIEPGSKIEIKTFDNLQKKINNIANMLENYGFLKEANIVDKIKF